MRTIQVMLLVCALSLSAVAQAQHDNSMQNPVIENIMTRASVRSFTQQPVEQGRIDALLQAGMAAPTAMNTQPWHFVVVTDKDKLEVLQQYPSPLAIVVCGDTKKNEKFAVIDATLASENILLAAHALGLGGIWTAVYPFDERMRKVSSTLSLPDHLIPLNVIIIGYADKASRAKDKFEKENISYNTFGGKQ